MQSNVLVFAKRSLNLSKIMAGLGLGLAALGIFVIFALSLLAGSSSAAVFFLPVSFMSLGLLIFTMPVTLLYVYDKNNGVLEYLLSLGWNQSDVFKQYLKAALFLAVIFFTGEGVAILVAGAISGSMGVFLLDLLVLFLTAFLGFSVVSLVAMAMMAFSSLQKQRVGANSPLGTAIGVPFIFPIFYLSFIGFIPELIVVLSLCVLAGALSGSLLLLSSRLIRREKMLP
ncbi:MAG TPA: hypothetical protein VLU95_04735 [Candidatus Acidoferrum sp.]|nr:hypothetical protein [Candidatus Acidoferrum sp.]